MTNRRVVLLALAALATTGCASLPYKDPLQVTVAGVDSLPGEGLEVRMLIKLRVLNPNETPIPYKGAYLKLDVMDKTFASGATSEAGTVPGLGEAVIAVPVTVSVLRMVRQVMGVIDGEPVDKIRFEMSGKLSGGAFGTERFQSQGEFELPKSTPEPTG